MKLNAKPESEIRKLVLEIERVRSASCQVGVRNMGLGSVLLFSIRQIIKNKVKTTGMCSSFRGLKPLSQGVGRIMLPLKPQKEAPSLPLPTSGSPRCSLPCSNITLIFASISYGHFLCVCLFVFVQIFFFLGFHLTLITFANTLFPSNVTFGGTIGWDFNLSFGGYVIEPATNVNQVKERN